MQQSLDEVGGELTHMRQELQKLLEVIQVKDAAIENLEEQLKASRQQANAWWGKFKIIKYVVSP